MLEHFTRVIGRVGWRFGRPFVALLFFALGSGSVSAQTWSWTFENVDGAAKFTSLGVDGHGNVHVSYTDNSVHTLKYAFRSADSSRWFTLEIDRKLQDVTTHLTLDSQGNPHICYPDRLTIKYAHWNGTRWIIQEIAPGGTKEYTCSLLVSSEGTPYVTWYQTRADDGSPYFHLRSAVLQDGAWLARTIDFDGEAGKWTSMAFDEKGQPFISYSSFPIGELRLAHWNGAKWETSFIDTINSDSTKAVRGMGNSLHLGPHGKLYVSYYGERDLRYAVQEGDHWVIQKVSDITPRGSWVGYWSSLDFDHAGHPHISYDDGGALKHAFWDGKEWRIQIIAVAGGDPYRYSALSIGPDDTIYISYRDPQGGSLKVAVGRPNGLPPNAAAPAASSKRN